MEPLTLIGTILGVALNVVLTSGHVLFTLVTVLGFTAYRTIEKGFKQREKELKFIADQAANGEQYFFCPNENFHFGTMNTLAYPLLSGVAGVCAGSLGIAGGLIKGPLMVDWGLAAQSATATAIFMIMFTSSSTILQFIILGRLELKISLLLWFTGFGGGLLGSKIVADVLRKIDRQSFVTFFLGFIIVASAVCMSSVVLLQMLGIFPQPRSDAGDLDYCDLAALH
eukprot:g16274.t1